MVNYKDKQIIYTFKYGGYISRRIKIVLYIVPIFIILLGLTIFTLLFIGKENGAWESLILPFLGVIFMCIFVFLFIKEKKHDKEIISWLNDENLCEAESTPWEFSNRQIGFSTYYRFGVDFDINDISCRKISSCYDAFYRKHANKIIQILYSPKYDQVMILKN